MKIEGIRYTGPILDNSGYAKACRENIMALVSQGIPVSLNPISFEQARPELRKEEKIIYDLIDRDIKCNVNFIHTTPEFWSKFKVPGMKNVGYTIWETTKLHHTWPDFINKNVDKVIVGCEWNKEVFKESGITIPIGVVPHCIDSKIYDNVTKYAITGLNDDTFVFYSILQWTERKNSLATIKAYWSAFQNDENVALVLKTYRSDYSEPEKEAIRTTLKRMKQIVVLPKYPKIYLILDMLSEDEISSLHARGNCYVSLDRGEGFGLSGLAAGANGNPIIVTGFGGALEYAKPDNSYLAEYVLTPVWGE